MHKKSLKKKIALHRETLAQLDDNPLGQVVGGATNGTCFCTDTCTLMPNCH